MATPYFQILAERVASTQDVARSEVDVLPVLVLAPSQDAGRGRSGVPWLNAERALAASLALRVGAPDVRPFSLMAGLAAARVIDGSKLKWPNDLLLGDLKVGGILAERSTDALVVGFGLNLWWLQAPEGMGCVFGDDPGDQVFAEIGSLWGAELMRLIDGEGWPSDEYRAACVTIGREINWKPGGSGRAVGVGEDGGLMVETVDGVETIYSGVVSEIRNN
jgi:BirA family biotin operon repressor/biotin-[acetyl-CoA-carboxylase] ligase